MTKKTCEIKIKFNLSKISLKYLSIDENWEVLNPRYMLSLTKF